VFQLERTSLHYAMGLENVESLSSILIKAGAKRVLKDLVSNTSNNKLEQSVKNEWQRRKCHPCNFDIHGFISVS
jgi:hypothetical protein